MPPNANEAAALPPSLPPSLPPYLPNDETTKRAVAGGGPRPSSPRLAADKDVTTAVDGGMEQLAELLVD